MRSYSLTHLKELEAESIYVLREVVAQFENPVLLFSGGKDSIVCFHLARKAFWPAKVPFPLLPMWDNELIDDLLFVLLHVFLLMVLVERRLILITYPRCLGRCRA